MGNSILKKFFSFQRKKSSDELEMEMRERLARQEAERKARIEKRNEKMLKAAERRKLERSREEQKLKAFIQKEKQRAKQITKQISASEDYELIEKFVKHYGPEAHEERFAKLHRLIQSRGWEITDSDIRSLVRGEGRKQAELKVRELILRHDPKTYEEFIDSFVMSCDSRKKLHVRVLSQLLKLHKCHPGLDSVGLLSALRQAEERAELKGFESQISSGDDCILVDDLSTYTGVEFENFLEQLFMKMGFVVELTKMSGDQGADLIVEKLGTRSVVQAKRYGAKVGNKAIQEIVASIKFYHAEQGMVVSNNYFTSSALELAQANGIELIDKDKLEELINKYW